MKLDYTISGIFQEKSLSELETLHNLRELNRTKIYNILALAVLKNPMHDTYYQEIDQILLITNETSFGITHELRISLHYIYLKTELARKDSHVL